jgi:uncharacterized Zn finger protein (UPF0148 family)
VTTQPGIFGHADTRTRQAELFQRGGRVSSLTCESCGEPLERTPGGFLACPRGHGKLYEACNSPAVWDGDAEDLFDTSAE